jgi:hypothetical protein
MRDPYWPIVLLVAVPAVIAVSALVAAIILFATANKAPNASGRTTRLVVGGVLLVLALGIGACYGAVFRS